MHKVQDRFRLKARWLGLCASMHSPHCYRQSIHSLAKRENISASLGSRVLQIASEQSHRMEYRHWASWWLSSPANKIKAKPRGANLFSPPSALLPSCARRSEYPSSVATDSCWFPYTCRIWWVTPMKFGMSSSPTLETGSHRPPRTRQPSSGQCRVMLKPRFCMCSGGTPIMWHIWHGARTTARCWLAAQMRCVLALLTMPCSKQ